MDRQLQAAWKTKPAWCGFSFACASLPRTRQI